MVLSIASAVLKKSAPRENAKTRVSQAKSCATVPVSIQIRVKTFAAQTRRAAVISLVQLSRIVSVETVCCHRARIRRNRFVR